MNARASKRLRHPLETGCASEMAELSQPLPKNCWYDGANPCTVRLQFLTKTTNGTKS
jgi:hypothetical protein